MAGLLAAQMLRRYRPTVIEAQPVLPDNHGALLRFRSDAVARATGIHLKKVRVTKDVVSAWPGTAIAHANMYSLKVTGSIVTRSIIDTAPVERWVAPPDFMAQLARDVHIEYDTELTELGVTGEDATISTIPMPALMKIAEWPRVLMGFPSRPIWTLNVRISVPAIELYQTLYFPDHDVPYYRASLTGNLLTIEYAGEDHEGIALRTSTELRNDVIAVLTQFGITGAAWGSSAIKFRRQHFGKILPVDETERKSFIVGMTDLHNVYSLGRFATWRQIILDDVVKDVEWIAQAILQRSKYDRRLRA